MIGQWIFDWAMEKDPTKLDWEHVHRIIEYWDNRWVPIEDEL